MKTGLVVTLALALGPSMVGVTLARISLQPPGGHAGGMMGSGMGMMGAGQMGQMMPTIQVMQACTEMMNQMSAMMGHHHTPG